jgi:hypothetical protein
MRSKLFVLLIVQLDRCYGLAVSFYISSYLSSVLKHSLEAWIRHLYFLVFIACFCFVSVTHLHVLSVLYAWGCLLKYQEALSLSVKVGNLENLLFRKRKGHLRVGY